MAEGTELLESGTPEAAQFESMSEAELGKVLDSGAMPEPKATPAPTPAAQAPKPVESQPTNPWDTKPSPLTIEDLAKRLEAIQQQQQRFGKENGQWRNLQSKLAELEKKIQAPTQVNTEQISDQEALAKYVKQQLKETLDTDYKDSIELINELKNQQQERQFNDAYKGALTQACTYLETDFNELNPVMAKMVKDATQAWQAGNDNASKWLDYVLSPQGPGFLVAAAIREKSKQVQDQGAQFNQQRQAAAVKAGQTLKTSASPKVTGSEKTQEELDKMSVEELEALLKEQGA